MPKNVPLRSALAAVACLIFFSSSKAAESHPNKELDSSSTTLQEVIVTAQKREERLQDVPIPVSVLSADTLVASNQVRLQDFYATVPSLSVAPGLQSVIPITIRGLLGASTIDDVPLAPGSGLLAADLDPGDLARIEVLRGPQGTLYGASSEGGLIRYVTADPSTDGVRGRVDAGTSSVYNGAEFGYTFRGSINLPISGDLAMLASAFTRQDPGYIDNPILGVDGINKAHTDGGHIALLWRPSDTLSLKLNALYQHVTGDGTNDVDVLPGLGPWQQNYIRGAGPYQRTAQIYTAVLNDKIGIFDLTSVTGYQWIGIHDTFDYSSVLGPYVQNGVPGSGFNGFGQPGALTFDDSHTTAFSQEIRLSAPIGQKIDALLGAFYTNNNTPYSQVILSTNPITGAVAGQFVYITFPTAIKKYAGFVDLTYHVTNRFDFQLGGREEDTKTISYGTASTGPYNVAFLGVPSSPAFTSPGLDGKSNAFTYLLTPKFTVSPNLMVYSRLASGFAPGTPNPALPGIPPESKPDTVDDYEIGAKGNLLDHKLAFDAAVYYIKHKDIQVIEQDPRSFQSFAGNGGTAKSQGIELAIESRPITGLRIAAWAAWNEAVLTETAPDISRQSPFYGAVGQTLPLAPRFSGNGSIDEEFPLLESVTGFVGGSVSFVGERQDQFVAGRSRRDLPAYTKTDLRAGIKCETWTAQFYANNVANRRGLISGDPQNILPFSVYYITPRMVGLSLSKSF